MEEFLISSYFGQLEYSFCAVYFTLIIDDVIIYLLHSCPYIFLFSKHVLYLVLTKKRHHKRVLNRRDLKLSLQPTPLQTLKQELHNPKYKVLKERQTGNKKALRKN